MNKRTEGLKRLRHSAGLDGYPLPSIHDAQKPARALVITCSESPALAGFVASLDPLCTLQNLGGTLPSLVDERDADRDIYWGNVAYALEQMGLRHVVFCGHSRCVVPSKRQHELHFGASLESRQAERPAGFKSSNHLCASQHWMLEQMQRLCGWLNANPIGGKPNTDIAMHLLWFDEEQGDIFAYSRDKDRFVLMSDLDMDRLFAVLEGGCNGIG